MNFACIIPARGGSKGIPKKNINPLSGKPMIAWSIEQALASTTLNKQVYVSSDCDEILEVSREFGAQPIKRPDELANDTATSESALVHAIEHIEAETGKPVDVIVFLQCTSPVRRLDDIENAIQTFLKEDADSLLSVCPLQDYFLWKKEGESHNSVNFDYKNRKRRQDIELSYLENGSIYVFKKELLLENNNRLGGKIAVYPMDKVRSHQIDNMEDIHFCEYILTQENY